MLLPGRKYCDRDSGKLVILLEWRFDPVSKKTKPYVSDGEIQWFAQSVDLENLPVDTNGVKELVEKGVTDEVEIACQLGLAVPDARSAIQEFLTKNVCSDDQGISPEQKLRSLIAEIKDIRDTIESSLLEIGRRLKIIKEEKLYQLKGYADFKEFCEKELSFNHNYAYKRIVAADILDDIVQYMNGRSDKRVPLVHESMNGRSDKCVPVVQNLPERCIRPLSNKKLTTSDRVEILEEIIESGEPITEKKVREKVMKKITRDSQVENPPDLPKLEVGDWVQITLSTIIPETKPYQGQIVQVVDIYSHGYKVAKFGGFVVPTFFKRAELIQLHHSAVKPLIVELPVWAIAKLSEMGIEDPGIAIAKLIGTTTDIEAP